jgi:Rrf2 family protein
MQISPLEEYGLRCALRLAAQDPSTTIAASQIAELEGISVRYASKILHLFRRADLIESQRGIQGGFRLGRPASQISVKEVFMALQGKAKNASFCDQYKGLQSHCVHLGSCSVRPVWQVLSGYFDNVLEKLSLADLAVTEESSRLKVEGFAQAESNRLKILFNQRSDASAAATRSQA